MSGVRLTYRNLTGIDARAVTFLTLALFSLLFGRLCHAETYYTPEQKQQINDIENYVRKESLQGVSLLPSEIRHTISWFSGGWHAMAFGGGEQNSDPGDMLQPIAEQSVHEDGFLPPMNLGGTFHHKGFLPTHDAMVMGVGVGRNALDNKLKFSAHPFYGQNWRSLQGYWGTELAMDIDKRRDGLPWGRIAIGYVDGNESLTDGGRGIDLHGDVDLTQNLKFTSGMRQSSSVGDSNYVMLRWKMSFD